MPPPMKYPESLMVRLPDGTRDRISALQAAGEQLADTQRRVVLAGLDALEENPCAVETALFPEAGSPTTLVVPAHYTAEERQALVDYLRAHAAGNPIPPPKAVPLPPHKRQR